MDDASIIELYFCRNEEAIKETDAKYGKLCFKLANNMLNNKQDSEECVSDTYMTAWNAIPPTRPDRFPAFLCKITKNLTLKKIEYNAASKRNKNMSVSIDELADCVSDKLTAEDEMLIKELSAEINRFLSKQKERDQVIFVKRYWFYESVSDIAKELEITEKNASVILLRLRQKLKAYLTKEGYNL